MSIIAKTPFRSSGLETDPIVYGLRPEELRQGIYQLYNDKSLLITGTRGIGKSSFCYQLQKIVKGDDTLLKRCALEISMPKFITVSYVCTPDDTIETIVLSIINDLEEQIEDCREKYKIKTKEFDVSIFGAIKSKIAIYYSGLWEAERKNLSLWRLFQGCWEKGNNYHGSSGQGSL